MMVSSLFVFILTHELLHLIFSPVLLWRGSERVVWGHLLASQG